MHPAWTKAQWDFDGIGEVLLFDKPLDWTSFDAVKKIRSLFHIRKAGHAGTLDPRATGLLIVATGAETKNMHRYTMLEKEYVGSMQLGIRTPSFDSETEVVERLDFAHITLDAISAAMAQSVGTLMQVPPMYSASKYGGKPLYKYARMGKTVERAPKEIEVKEFSAVKFDLPHVEFKVVCSKGTYVRTLVDDLGRLLGCGACLVSLRRIRIGEYRVEDACSIEAAKELAAKVQPRLSMKYAGSVPAQGN